MQVGLKLYTLEDATFGYWLQPWDVRHVNHTRFRLVRSAHGTMRQGAVHEGHKLVGRRRAVIMSAIILSERSTMGTAVV